MTQYGQAEVGAALNQKWGQSSTDTTSIQGDTSRDRRETQGTSTNLSQMYNLLTGYHTGTNRAVFLMLPRPHTLQPTDHRTFINGLRIIEGVQDFFLVIARPNTMSGLCVETWLETGHFPEHVTVSVPPPVYDLGSETFRVTADAQGGGWGSNYTQIEKDPSATHTLAAGWVVDRTNPGSDPGHPGITVVSDVSWGAHHGNPSVFNLTPQPHGQYQPTDGTVQVSGTIWSNGGLGAGAHYDVTFTVFTRSEQPIPNPDPGPIVTTPALITARGLCVCFESGDSCPVILSVRDPSDTAGNGKTALFKGVSIVYEPQVPIDTSLLTSGSRLPAIKAMLSKMHTILATNWRLPGRHAPGTVGFLDSDYVNSLLTNHLSQVHLSRQIGQVSGLPIGAVNALGATTSVGDVLNLKLHHLSRRAGISLEDAVAIRRKLLGKLVGFLDEDPGQNKL